MTDIPRHPETFAGIDLNSLHGEELMMAIAERYRVPLDASGAAMFNPVRDGPRAEDAMASGLFLKVKIELSMALEELEKLLAQPKTRTLQGEEVEEISDAHFRFWHAKNACESLLNLLVGHLMHP